MLSPHICRRCHAFVVVELVLRQAPRPWHEHLVHAMIATSLKIFITPFIARNQSEKIKQGSTRFRSRTTNAQEVPLIWCESIVIDLVDEERNPLDLVQIYCRYPLAVVLQIKKAVQFCCHEYGGAPAKLMTSWI